MSHGRAPRFAVLAAAGLVTIALIGCAMDGQGATDPPGSSSGSTATDPAVLLAVGDISTCKGNDDEAVARLVSATPGLVALLGDIAYPDGSEEDFRDCFAPAWHGLANRLRPVPGNHEYETSEAAPYFAYFGASAALPGRGWYAYDLDAWRIYALNSNCDAIGGCGLGSPQLDWLADDLARHPRACALAYWHHPRFSSGRHGDAPSMGETWAVLEAAGTDVVLAGHDHTYERFAPLGSDGAPNPDGPRSFVVGTGGRGHYSFEHLRSGSEVRDKEHFGILRLDLADGRYGWRFLATDSTDDVDSGQGECR